jgi:hypothetical protein
MSDAKIESAKTGRSKCRKCREGIAKDELRLGIISYQFDTDGSWTWYHLPCGAALNPESFESAVVEYGAEIPDIEELRKAAKIAARKNLMPRIEAAPSGRASCLSCRETIKPKGTLRVVVEREVDDSPGLTRPGYLHVGCALGYVETEGDFRAEVLANSDLDTEQLKLVNAELK